MKDDVSNKPAH